MEDKLRKGDLTILGMDSDEERKELIRNNNPLTHYYSATSLSEYLKCPWRFKLKYIDGKREKKSIPLVLGSAFHQAMKFKMLGEMEVDVDECLHQELTDGDGIDFFGKDADNEIENARLLLHAMWDNLHDLEESGDYNLPVDIDPDHLESSPLALAADPEFYFTRRYYPVEYDDKIFFTLHGFIDAMTASELIDWKTSSQRWAYHRENYEFQSWLYLSAFRGIRDTLRYIIFLKHKKQKSDSIDDRIVKIPPDSLKYWEENVLVWTIHRIEEYDYSPTPSPDSCHYCTFRRDCPLMSCYSPIIQEDVE